ncbi:MAG TPA: LytTR family DNA-binding domain-containing protein [Pyrinomonadaceae bacterium]|jgi:two-component system LytT family response regulator
MSIKTIIVDDVELARERIKILLDDAEIEIVAECENGREAIETIRNLKPDLVFLDVQMPKIGGFDVIETIGAQQMPTVIFVTAYDEFALRAFEVNAIDYLLKPFDEERLAKAVARAKREIEREKPSEIEDKLRKLLKEVKTEPQYLKRIPVKSARGTTLILTEEIDWIAAAGHYLELHAGRETHLIREKLSQLEMKLDPQVFMRIHRSTIVNLDRVKSLHPLFNGDQLVILKDGKELNLSRTYYEKLMQRLAS